MWDGEERKLEQEVEKEPGKKEGKEGLRSRISDRLRKHRSPSPAKSSKATKPTSKQTQDAMPAPWTTASTRTRAEPRVLHGHTLTKEVPFRDVCDAVKEGAFVTR